MPVPDESDRELGLTGPEPPAEAPAAPEASQAPAAPETPEPPEHRPQQDRPQPTSERPQRSLAGDLAGDLAEVQRGRPERAFNLGLALGVVVAVAAAVFVIQNNQSTQFDWLWFDFELPLWTALLGAMAVGVVLVVIGFVVHERRQRRIGRRQDAAGRLRRALGPPDEPSQPADRRGGFLGRFRPKRA
jgi:uncharacterized integral membrane protein